MGTQKWSRDKGKSSRNPTSLYLLGVFPSSHRGWNSSYFLSLPSLTPSAFGLGFPFLSYLTQESTFFFFETDFRRKAKGHPGHGRTCSLASRHPGPRRWVLVGPARSPASCLAPDNSSVGILHKHAAFDQT